MKKFIVILLAVALTSCVDVYECVCVGEPTYTVTGSSKQEALEDCKDVAMSNDCYVR